MKFFHFFFVLLLIAASLFFVQNRIKQERQSAIDEISERLKLTLEIRKAQLKSEVKTIYSEIRFWAESEPLVNGFEDMLVAWNDLANDPKTRARQLYVDDNPLYPNYTADFFKADDGSAYSESHKKLHTLLKDLTKRRGYYDVFLIANNGDIVYSVFKEDDYATNLNTGKYKNSTLAQGFREVMDNTNLNHVSLFDFKAYEPSNNLPASFVQTSVVDSRNKTQGILVFQFPVEPIDKIMNSDSGLGKTAEILLVGSDNILRNHPDSDKGEEEVTGKIESEAIGRALKNKSGVEPLIDHKGNKTITAYAPFEYSHNVLGKTDKNTWAIIVKQDLSEVLDPVNERIKEWLIMLGVLTSISLLIAWLLTRKQENLSTTE